MSVVGNRRNILIALGVVVALAWLLYDQPSDSDAVVRADSDEARAQEPEAKVREVASPAKRVPTPVGNASAVSNAESEQADQIEFVVRDDYGNFVDGAIVHFDDLDEFVEVGRTSSAGKLVATMPDKAVTWSVAKEGYVTARFERELPGTERVILESAPTIHGVITFPDGLTPCAGVNVVVFKQLQRPRLAKLSVADSLYPSVATTTSDGSGRFAIRGLAPGKDYRIEGGGNGYVFGEQRIAEECFEGLLLEIRATRLFGIRVLYRDVEGKQPRTDSLLHQTRGSEFEIFSLGPRVHQTSLAAALAGINTEIVGHEFQVLIQADTDMQVLGPFEYTLALPGYQSISDNSNLYPVVDSVATHTITLTPNSTNWGRLRIVDYGLSDERVYANGNIATLGLRSTQPGTPEYQFLLRQWPSEPVLIDGIPYGEYDLNFNLHQTVSNVPAQFRNRVVKIGATEASLEIDSKESGAMRIQILDSSGEQYTGFCSIQMITVTSGSSNNNSRSASASFERSPYLVQWIKPGMYELILRQPFAAGASREVVRITVKAGETSETTLTL
ncbi:MAG: hypothetical protein ACI87A_001986 [Planctomycetota bacterium]|jgi:hypothetical protein